MENSIYKYLFLGQVEKAKGLPMNRILILGALFSTLAWSGSEKELCYNEGKYQCKNSSGEALSVVTTWVTNFGLAYILQDGKRLAELVGPNFDKIVYNDRDGNTFTCLDKQLEFRNLHYSCE
jgi:hypothetical protein